MTRAVASPKPATTERSPAYRAARGLDEGQPAPRPAPADTFNAAREVVARGERMDMQKLARDLGISRATLYRWTGSREQLLSDIWTSMSEDALAAAAERTAGESGVERIVAALEFFVRGATMTESLRRFVSAETQLASRILTAQDGDVHRSVVKFVTGFLKSERDRGNLSLRAEAPLVAESITLLVEGFLYRGAMTGSVPDLEAPAQGIRLMLE